MIKESLWSFQWTVSISNFWETLSEFGKYSDQIKHSHTQYCLEHTAPLRAHSEAQTAKSKSTIGILGFRIHCF